MTRLITVALILAVFFSVSAYAGDDSVAARIGDKQITMSDLERIFSYYDAEKQKALEQNPQYKAVILQRIVQGMVISDVAREKGFDKDPHVAERLRLMDNDLLSSEYLKQEVLAHVQVTEDDMKHYYEAHKDEFRSSEMVRARHILINVEKTASEDDRKSARGKAEAILKRIKEGEDFATVAEDVSDDTGTKAKGGDLGFFPRGKMAPDFEKAAFSLKPGEMSDIVETPYGYHIIMVEEKKDEALEPFETVKEVVRKKALEELRKAKVDEFVEKAMNDAKVELHLERFLPKQ